LEISSDTVHVYTDVWGELALSRNVVRGVIWRVPSDTREHWRLRDDLKQPHEELDLLKLVNGDQLRGNVLTAGGGQLTFRSAAGDVSLTMDRLQSWRSAHDKMSRDEQQSSVIGFRDGTLLVAKSVSLDQQLDVELACGPRLITRPEVRLEEEAIVTYYRPYNSRVVYLSDLESIGHKHVPLLSLNWDWQRDRNVLGGPLSSGRGMHEKGIGMHSTARLAFDLDDTFEEFQAEASLDVTAGRQGSVVFRVFTSSGEGGWSQAFASSIVRGTSSPVAIRVDIRQARRIAIVVDYADGGDVLDRANWIGARLIRAPPANGGT
jgi:hypothetical protein